MDRTIALNYVTVSGKRQFIDQNLLGGVPGTEMVAADPNAWQEEVLGPIEGMGLTPSAVALKQLWQAIRRASSLNTGATITVNTTLTADNAGLVVVNATGGNITLTLPLSNSAGGVPFRYQIARIDAVSANTVTLAFAGADGPLFAEPITVAPLQVLAVGATGGTTWINFYENAPASLVAAGGWERKPSGIIEQWGQGAVTSATNVAVIFPIAFPTACAGVLVNERNAAGWAGGSGTLYGASGASTTGCTIYGWVVASSGALSAPTTPGIAFFWRAMGW